MNPYPINPYPDSPADARQRQSGFRAEELTYKRELKEFPTGQEILDMIDRNRHLMTAQSIDTLKAFVNGCINHDAVLTNFPTMADIKAYREMHKMASIKLKFSIP